MLSPSTVQTDSVPAAEIILERKFYLQRILTQKGHRLYQTVSGSNTERLPFIDNYIYSVL